MNELSNFIYKKKYGQNFLKDSNILDNIVKESNVQKDTLVIEVGVGSGALTKVISKNAGQIIGYEIDSSLKPILEKDVMKISNVQIVFDDFLKRNIKDDLSLYDYKNIMVVANLPYYITTPIVMKFINEQIPINKMVIMVQNEVADRFNATVGSKSYNSLSVYLKYYFDIKKAFTVSRNCFYPKPNVDSAVIVFNKKTNSYNVLDEDLFFKLVRDSFKQKRKTLKNNLKNYDIDVINESLKSFGKDISYRAENITIDEFISVANLLSLRSKQK